MLTFDWNHRRDDPAFHMMLARLKALVADMEAVRNGTVGKELPDDAPVLDQWAMTHRSALCLTGRSTGHPLLPGAGREIVTSDLWLLSKDKQWARTLSRWYRLDEPRRQSRGRMWRQ